ncbi:hypothetical protein L1987_43393 [Smallanthus sonchifolius]|uniref:Uncharacterized protein n=1 Tax=Smallanthus sonchifolius TaxID=185202 RepID=A0ACB9GM70_9ASTR|nr:hypothetical protein L1987_43393 [Smallanthus sonchifolius]
MELWNTYGLCQVATCIGNPLTFDKITAERCVKRDGIARFAIVLVKVEAKIVLPSTVRGLYPAHVEFPAKSIEVFGRKNRLARKLEEDKGKGSGLQQLKEKETENGTTEVRSMKDGNTIDEASTSRKNTAKYNNKGSLKPTPAIQEYKPKTKAHSNPIETSTSFEALLPETIISETSPEAKNIDQLLKKEVFAAKNDPNCRKEILSLHSVMHHI